MRDGSETIGVHELCARSVQQARTPQAAAAIKYAFRNLGTPYSNGMRMQPGWFDCSSMVGRAYISAGVTGFFAPDAPSTGGYADTGAWQGILGRTTTVKPGDIRIMWPQGCTMAGSDGVGGCGGHAQLHLANGYIIQSGGGGDSRVNVSRNDTWGWNIQDFAHLG